jgi:hypothetical protein
MMTMMMTMMIKRKVVSSCNETRSKRETRFEKKEKNSKQIVFIKFINRFTEMKSYLNLRPPPLLIHFFFIIAESLTTL